MATAAMIPSADTGLAGIGGGADAELGSLLSAGWDAAADANGLDAGQQPGVDGSDNETGDPSGELNPAPTEDAAAEVKEPGVDVAADAASAYELTPDGKSYLVPKDRIPGFESAKKYSDAVSRYYQTPQEAESSWFQAADHRAITNDFSSGDPVLIQGFLDHWATGGVNASPATQQRHGQAFAKMAELVPGVLEKLNPQAYEGFVGGLISKAVDLAYLKAARSNNPEDFKRAQELDWGVTGNYKTELPRLDQRQAQLTREQAFEQRQAAAYNRDVSGFNSNFVEGSWDKTGTKLGRLSETIDARLAKVKAAYEPQAYADLKSGIHRDIIDRMQGRGPNPDPTAADWWREHVQAWNGLIADYKTTWEQGNPGAGLQARVQSYIQSFINRANRYLPEIATARIGPATRAQVNRANNGQFTGNKPQTRQAAPNTPPSNGQPKTSRSEQWDKEWADMFRTA